jgi:hypothetical protein
MHDLSLVFGESTKIYLWLRLETVQHCKLKGFAAAGLQREFKFYEGWTFVVCLLYRSAPVAFVVTVFKFTKVRDTMGDRPITMPMH